MNGFETIRILKDNLIHTMDHLNYHMGGTKSYCFLKAPTDFVEQVTDITEIFVNNAHKKLLRDINNQDASLEAYIKQSTDETEKILKETTKKVQEQIEEITLASCSTENSGHPEFDAKYIDECPLCFPKITLGKWECQEYGCGKINNNGAIYCTNTYCNGRADKRLIYDLKRADSNPTEEIKQNEGIHSFPN